MRPCYSSGCVFLHWESPGATGLSSACSQLMRSLQSWHTVPSSEFSSIFLGISKTCTHPMVHLFHVISGRLPQPLQVLMFALPKPLPQHTALTSWRLWNNLELMSGTLQMRLHCVCYWRAKYKRSAAELYWYFACKTFLQISQLFQQLQPEAIAGCEYCLWSTNTYLSSFCALTKRLMHPVSDTIVHICIGPFSD